MQLKVNVPSAPVGMGSGGSVECEVVGDVEQIDSAVALINQSIQQSELSRRRQALAGKQNTRKPAVSGGWRVESGECIVCFKAVVSAIPSGQSA